jgi:hypothetical protein
MKLQRLRIIHLDSSSECSDIELQTPSRIKVRNLKKTLVSLKGKQLNELDITLLKGVILSNPYTERNYFKEKN